MAKQTAKQVVNKILENLGEVQVANLMSLSGLSLLVFNTLNEALYDLSNEYFYKPLEVDISLTMTSGVGTYSATNFLSFDKDSFKYDRRKPISVPTFKTFDRNHIDDTVAGEPSEMYDWGGVFRVYPVPNQGADGKVIRGRGWGFPTIYATDNPTGTSWIPEGFDITLLADYVTMKVMIYKENSQYAFYAKKVYGDPQNNVEGSLNKLKKLFGSQQLGDGNIMVEPIGDRRRTVGFVQTPITGS